ncbi:MAG: invasion associated locus B family protein [Tardiphaga sp.]
MNFRLMAASVLPRRVFALLAATALTATMITVDAQAQAPAPGAPPAAAPKAAPKAPPKAAPRPGAPAPAAQAPAGAAPGAPPEQQVQLIYAPWTKFCLKGQDANAKQVCFTGKDGRIESGQPVIAAVIIEPEGEPKKILRVTLPLGMQLVHGTRVIVDANAPAQSPYVICFANGCMSDYEVTPELLANMKKGQNLIVQAINSNGAPLTLPLPLGEFAKAYDGPPTDPKVFEETQKKLQEELQKRAAEAREKLQATQGGAGGTPANPAAK